jgi:hypothetical protein
MSDLFAAFLISNDGELALNGDPVALIEEAGLMRPAEVRRLVERGPLQHGDSDIGYRLEPRIAQVALTILPTSVPKYWQARTDLTAMLAPYRACTFEAVLPTGKTRRLDFVVSGAATMGTQERSGLAQGLVMAWRAADPTWYDPEERLVTFAMAADAEGTPVPTPVATPVGASRLDETETLNYRGDWQAFPIIRAYGPLGSLLIENLTTGERLRFAGSWGTGRYREIDCRYGHKTVTNQAGENRISELSADSDLATFHLAPMAINSVRVTAVGANPGSRIEIRYFERYLGI